MNDWKSNQTLFLILGVVCLIVVAFLFAFKTISDEIKLKNKYLDVVFPKTDLDESEFKIDKKGNKKKVKKSKLKVRLNKFFVESKTAKKVSELYYRAGKNGDFKNLVFDGFKYLILGIAIFFLFYYAIQNAFIAGFIAILIVAMPYITLISKIQAREKEFRNAFPYFLQTVAFVLKNGTNFSSAFYEVVHKQEEGVLKEIMLEVLEIRNINAGNDKVAFAHIVDKMKIEEASEFVNVVSDNLTKGTSIADTFLQQAENTTKILNLNKKRKISSASTKILLPILVMCMALAVLFLQMF